MDPLTQTIALLRPQGLLWKQAEARGDWAIRVEVVGGVEIDRIDVRLRHEVGDVDGL